jgi:hypothetical protein
MAEVSVVLEEGDHICCGPRRRVGDIVTMQIHNVRGQVYEERHPSAVSVATQSMTGTIVRMEWRPARLQGEIRGEGFNPRTLAGYGTGIPIESTDYEDPSTVDGVFEFTIETKDPIPALRKERLSTRPPFRRPGAGRGLPGIGSESSGAVS